MPIYEYKHPVTGEIFEKFRPAKDYKKPLKLKDGTICPRLMSLSSIQFIDESRIRPNTGDPVKDAEYEKKVKCPERAMRNRKKLFGTEGVSITKSPFYKKEKRIKAQGTSQEINKADFVKMAAKNPNAVAAARKIVGK
jgi:predicted nucleic acid-binding Zn ribbon protein